MSNHVDLPSSDAHTPFRWIFADNTERTGQSVTVDDLTKTCLVEDDDGSGNAAVYVLTAVTPTWKKIGGPGTAETLIGAGAGANSIILNGLNNTAAGDYAIAGGYNAQAGGNYGVALGNYANAYGENGVAVGGYQAYAYGNNSAVIGGESGQANGTGSIVLAGANNYANGTYSNAMGSDSNARLRSQFALSAGNFDTNGDSQVSIYNLRRSVTHSDANWYSLFMNGTSEYLTIPTDTLFNFIILLTGITSGAAKSLAYKIEGAIVNDGGTTSLLASTVTTVYETDTDFAAQVVADDTNDALLIQVQDTTSGGDLVYWTATVLVSEVAQA